MRTQDIQIGSRRRLLASLLLVIAVVTRETQVAESAEERVSQSEVVASKLKTARVDAILEIAKGRGHAVGAPKFCQRDHEPFDRHLLPSVLR